MKLGVYSSLFSVNRRVQPFIFTLFGFIISLLWFGYGVVSHTFPRNIEWAVSSLPIADFFLRDWTVSNTTWYVIAILHWIVPCMMVDFLLAIYRFSTQQPKLALKAFTSAAISVAASAIFLQGAQYVELLCWLIGVVIFWKRGGTNRTLLVGVYTSTIFIGFALTSLLLLGLNYSDMGGNAFLFVMVYFYFPPMVLVPTLGTLVVSNFGNWQFKPKPGIS